MNTTTYSLRGTPSGTAVHIGTPNGAAYQRTLCGMERTYTIQRAGAAEQVTCQKCRKVMGLPVRGQIGRW